jgi:hypothetical protein
MDEMQMKKRGLKSHFWLILLVVGVLVWAWWNGSLKLWGGGEYQAVFLDNNQVYFGKISGAGSQFARLTEIYYLQVNQAIQPKGQGAQPAVNLVKLGGELHGPADEMLINRDHILFYEDLKADSQVVRAIGEYKKSQAQ